ncbi:hypothetical protein BH24ACT5_BH24ACT5_10030 [soil metagenome]
MIVAGGTVAWRCAVCRTTVDAATPHGFVCPRSTPTDRHHVLHPVSGITPPAPLDHPNPFVAYGPRMAWWTFGTAHGMREPALVALAEDVAAGFAVTPFGPHRLHLTRQPAAATPPTEIGVKDETGNVGGSHKARHLVGILLHLRATEHLGLAPPGPRPPLAIASCGNAAVAAATLAQRTAWPLQVFVPDWASPAVLDLLNSLGASITVCPRPLDGPPGDPAVLAFRAAVAAGALPFSVQGPENALCLDGGRTLGWELADQATPHGGLDRAAVQVGGGAFAACVGWGLGPSVRLDTVQTQGCAPLARAWWRARDRGLDPAGTEVASHWSELMTPWADPRSRADGILDDETYDWLGDVAVMAASGGRPLVVPEEAIDSAVDAAATTGIPVSATGVAGLAGLMVGPGRPRDGERVAVIFSGVEQ